MNPRVLRVLIISTAITIPTSSLLTQDWPQWRGPGRDGQVAGFKAPAKWPAALKKRWSVAVGGGYGSPVVVGGKIFLHTREEGNEVVSAVDLANGKTLWRDQYPAPFEKNQYALKHGEGPFATPLVADGRLYTLGVSGIFSCFDAANGKLLWRHDHSDRVTTLKLFTGSASSPVADGQNVIAFLGDDRAGALTAFDAASGEIRWTWSGAGPGYASPIVAELAGVRQVVTLTSNAVVGVAAADGKQLWTIPFPDEWNENIITPVLWQNLLIFAGVRQGSRAVEVVKKDGGLKVREVWRREDLPMYMSTPVVADGVLFGLSNRQKGQLFALDPKNGKTFWLSEGRQADNFALLTDGSLLFLLDTMGQLTIARASRQAFEPITRYQVAEAATWTHPVLTQRGLLVKDVGKLTLWGVD